MLLAANRIGSAAPSFLVDAITRWLIRALPRCYDVTRDIDPSLVGAVGECYGQDFRGVRFVRIDNPMVRRAYAALFAPAIAFAWANTVYLMGAAMDWRRRDEVLEPKHANTIAHELWHVHQFRSVGGGLLWVGRWLRQRRRVSDIRDMPIEREAREQADRFIRSAAYRAVAGAALGEHTTANRRRPAGRQ